jgi:hypothetical protein
LSQVASFPIFGRQPAEGSRYTPLVFDFSQTTQTTITQTVSLLNVGMSQIRGILVDNSLNPRGAFISIQDTQQALKCRPGFQLRDEIFTGGLTVTITVASTGGVPVNIKLFNVPLRYYHDYSFNANATAAQLPTFTQVDTVCGGTVVQIAPANPKRSGFFIIALGTTTASILYVYAANANGVGFQPSPFMVVPTGGGYATANWMSFFQESDSLPVPTCAIGALATAGSLTAIFNELTL